MACRNCGDFHTPVREVVMMWRGAGPLHTLWSVETRRFTMNTELLSKLSWCTLGFTSLKYSFFYNKEKHARLFPRGSQSSSGKYGAFDCFRKEPDQCLLGTAVFKICLSPWPVQVSPIYNRFDCIVLTISNSVSLVLSPYEYWLWLHLRVVHCLLFTLLKRLNNCSEFTYFRLHKRSQREKHTPHSTISVLYHSDSRCDYE